MIRFFPSTVRANTPRILKGVIFSFGGTWEDNPANTPDKVFDGDFDTFWDGNTATGAYVGIELVVPAVVVMVRFSPRQHFQERMDDGRFQGSNTSRSEGYIDLYVIPRYPVAVGVYTEMAVTDPTAYKYLRYVGGENSYGNISEIQFIA